MPEYCFRLVNVFTRERAALSGNPLCVFEDAEGLGDVDVEGRIFVVGDVVEIGRGSVTLEAA